MNVRIIRNESRIKARIEAGKKAMLAAVTEQVIRDGNYYCPQDQGVLMSSALSASQPEKGLAIWNTLYAKRRYYTGTPRHAVNPNASLMWCEKAHETFGADWLKLADKVFKEGMD